MPALLTDATTATEPQQILFADRERNDLYYIGPWVTGHAPLWSCDLHCRDIKVATRDGNLRECQRVGLAPRFVEMTHELFDGLPQAIEFSYTPGRRWHPFVDEEEADSHAAKIKSRELVGEVDDALRKVDCYWQDEVCHLWVGTEFVAPFALKPLNLDAYLALRGRGAPEVILTTSREPRWIVTRYCGQSLAEGATRTDLSCLSWHQIGSMFAETLAKVHAIGWAIRTAMTPESVWFDTDFGGRERCGADGDEPPPYGFGPEGHGDETDQYISWKPVRGVYFVDLRLAGPASAAEQAADVENMKRLFPHTHMTCDGIFW